MSTHPEHHTTVTRENAATILSALTGYVEDISNEEAWDMLPDSMRGAVVVHHNDDRPATQDEPTPGPSVDTAPCGHTHASANYERGCIYATHITRATNAAHIQQFAEAQAHAATADRTLWDLGNLNDPDDLRDFIAGLANHFGNRFRELGLTIPA